VSALQKCIESAISEATGESFQVAHRKETGGGCINSGCLVTGTDGRRFFIKYNRLEFQEAFEVEFQGLLAMAETATIRVPRPVAVGRTEDQAILVMEFLEMGGSRGGDWRTMGTNLARMHRHSSDRFGWHRDNFIGATPQINTWQAHWPRFYAECRLQPQFERARKRGLRLDQADALLHLLPKFFGHYQPTPSLLHGDLWAGNAGFMKDGSPVIFDPACYFGDRETDLAMTEMFGGYAPEFYQAYNEEWSLDEGYRLRKDLYILYHLVNHYNLFGGGYGSQAESSIASLLASVS